MNLFREKNVAKSMQKTTGKIMKKNIQTEIMQFDSSRLKHQKPIHAIHVKSVLKYKKFKSKEVFIKYHP